LPLFAPGDVDYPGKENMVFTRMVPSAFNYYQLGLKKISVGGQEVDVPSVSDDGSCYPKFHVESED
jgi:hypothetical protein